MSESFPPTDPVDSLDPIEPEHFVDDDVDLKELIAQKERGPVPRFTKILLGALVIVVAFFAGSLVQQHFGPTGSTASFGGGGFGGGRFAGGGNPFAAAGSASTGGAGPGTGGFGGGGVTVGSITLVDGSHIYVTDTSGQIVKVNVSSSTTITAQTAISASKLKPGEQVIVRGAAGSDGTVAATTITQGSLPNAARNQTNGAGQ